MGMGRGREPCMGKVISCSQLVIGLTVQASLPVLKNATDSHELEPDEFESAVRCIIDPHHAPPPHHTPPPQHTPAHHHLLPIISSLSSYSSPSHHTPPLHHAPHIESRSLREGHDVIMHHILSPDPCVSIPSCPSRVSRTNPSLTCSLPCLSPFPASLQPRPDPVRSSPTLSPKTLRHAPLTPKTPKTPKAVKDNNPLDPCGACSEWLRKIAEINPDFKVVTFTSLSCSHVYSKTFV